MGTTIKRDDIKRFYYRLAPIHTSIEIEKMVHERNQVGKHAYLPPYLPELNPIR